MTGKRFNGMLLSALLLCLAATVFAGGDPVKPSAGLAWQDNLPDPVAECGSIVIGKQEALALLREDSGTPSETESPERTRSRLEALLFRSCCRKAMAAMLAGKGFSPSRELAEKMLRKKLEPFGKFLGPMDEKAVERAAGDREIQLRMAALAMLESKMPARLRVTDAETEQVYREQQLRFYRRARYRLETVMAPETRAGYEALCRLAASTGPDDPVEKAVEGENLSLEFRELSNGPPETWSRIEGTKGRYSMSRTILLQAAGFFPLKEAAPLIRMELREKKAAEELRNQLEQYLRLHPVKLHLTGKTSP